MSRNPFPPGRKQEVVTRDAFECQAPYWDRESYPSHEDCIGPLVVHHRLPKQMGGSRDPMIHDQSNLLTLCDMHHRHVHANPRRSYETMLLVRRNGCRLS